MVLVGLLLIAAAAGFTIDVFAQNTAPVDVDVLGRTFAVDPGWLVVAGVVAVAVLLVGARFVVAGMARARGRRAALRSAQRATRERDQLAQQLAVERAERDRGQAVTTESEAGSPPAPNVPGDRTGSDRTEGDPAASLDTRRTGAP